MRFTRYTRYTGDLADALNLETLLEHLSDFLIQAGFEGDSHEHPWWGRFEDADRSRDALKEALVRALVESGEITPEMLVELRGEGSNADARGRVGELLDRLVERLVDEGYLEARPAGGAGSGSAENARSAARQVEFAPSARGLDFLAYRTLRQLLGGIGASGLGAHPTSHLSTGVEAEGASRPYRFGDAMNLDIPETLKHALMRGGVREDGTIDLTHLDLHVHQAEHRSSCATVLLLDTSHSMILYGEDRFNPAKKVALALAHLIRTQFPGDSLRVVTFGDEAREIPLARLHEARVGPFHTNTADALRIARRLLVAQKQDMRQIVMITDGNPSAVTLPDGSLYRNPGGLDPAVLEPTYREVGACRRSGIVINTFMLARDPALVGFVDRVSEIARGKAYFTTTMTLGQFVMKDYLSRKTRRG